MAAPRSPECETEAFLPPASGGEAQQAAASRLQRAGLLALPLALLLALVAGYLNLAPAGAGREASSSLPSAVLEMPEKHPKHPKKERDGGHEEAQEQGAAPSQSCPVCAPKERVAPDVVIPFFERDLCKLKYTAKSISVNDPNHYFGNVYLLWISTTSSSDYREELAEVAEQLSQSHRMRLIEFTDLMEFTDSLGGWHAQQVSKLKIASVVQSEYYVVLDSKNTLIRELTPDILFDECNRARVQVEFPAAKIPIPHIDWYKASADALGLDPPQDGYWPASITPVVFHTRTVLDMLESIGEGSAIDELCSGPLCDMFGARDISGQGATEFTMYTLWSFSQPDFECLYSVQHEDHFKMKYSASWKDELKARLADMGFTSAEDLEKVTVSDQAGYPVGWVPGTDDDVPKKGDFPLMFEDLTSKWACSLWRGMPETADLLSKVNIETLSAIVGGRKQNPIMFGAQPASLKTMPDDEQEQATELLVKLYSSAGLFDADKETAEDLVDCVVGWHNGIR